MRVFNICVVCKNLFLYDCIMVDYTSSPFSVLLADDDDSDRILFKDAIQQLDLKISLEMVDSGDELMKHLSDTKKNLPDFIFLDLNMPKKNGFECLQEMRNNERLKKVSVIIYSASSKLEDIHEALNKGANLYFSKSSTFQELVNRLQRIFAMNWEEFNADIRMEKFVFLDEVAF